MSDSWINKTEEEIRQEVFVIAKEETKLTNFKSTGVLRGFLEVLIRIVNTIYINFINPILKQTNINTATGLFLSLWALLCGVARKKATKTTGILSGTGSATGTIAAGSWITVDGTSLRFKVMEEVSIITGDFLVPVEAEFEGINYNITPGTGMHSTQVFPGLESIVPGENWISSLGTDEEKDEPLRQRIIDRWRSIGEGYPKSKYEYIAATIPGVVEAKVLRTPRGHGSMDILISAVNGLPSETLIIDVKDKLGDLGLVCRDQRIRGPFPKYIDIEIEFTGDPTESEIEIATRNYILGIGIGKELEMRKFYVDPWEDYNFSSLEILAPVRDVCPQEYEMIIPQNITVRKV